METSDPQYVVYIDEAGDPGIKQKPTRDLSAASEWFVVSAVVVRSSRDRDTISWVSDMREAIRAQGRTPIHYRKLSTSNQSRVCRMLADKDVRIFVVASHKTNMRGHQNKKIGSSLGRGEFYNWCLRLLLERVTHWCANRSSIEGNRIYPARIVFSERGGHDYTHLRSYIENLRFQAVSGTTYLKAKEIVPEVLDPQYCDVRPHSALAGLQLADIAASAFFQGLDSKSPAYTLGPAIALKPRVARAPRQRTSAGFGLLKLPFQHQAEIPEEDRPLFEAFGYEWDTVAGPGLPDTD